MGFRAKYYAEVVTKVVRLLTEGKGLGILPLRLLIQSSTLELVTLELTT